MEVQGRKQRPDSPEAGMSHEATVTYLVDEFHMQRQDARFVTARAHSEGQHVNTRASALVTFTADGGFQVADWPASR
jgi:hypothetical protein